MLFLAPPISRGVTSRALEDLLERRDLVVAFGEGRREHDGEQHGWL